MKSLQELLNDLDIQIDNFHILYEQKNAYPDSNRNLLEADFNFYIADENIHQAINAESLAYLNTLISKIKRIKDNPEVIEVISTHLFSFVELWADYNAVKSVFEKKIKYYHKKIKSYRKLMKEDKVSALAPGKLKATAVRDLMELSFNEKDIFEFTNAEERDAIIDNLNKFIGNQLDTCTTTLKINNIENRLAYFLINQIAVHASIIFSEIKNIEINGSPFEEKKRQSVVSKIKKQIKQNNLDSKANAFVREVESIIGNHLG